MLDSPIIPKEISRHLKPYYLKSGTLFKTEVKKSGGVYATGNADSANFGDMMASFGLDPHYLPEPFIKALT